MSLSQLTKFRHGNSRILHSFKLGDKTVGRLRALSKLTGLTMTAVIEEAIHLLFEEEERRARLPKVSPSKRKD